MSDDQAASRVVHELADELTRARQRGVDELDLQSRQQRRVATPHLERLARVYTGDEASVRIPLIRQLLHDGLNAWEAEGRPNEAAFVRRLFFGPDGGTPGRRRPGDLLDAARSDTRLPQDSFDERRRAIFRLFAAFLVEFVDATHGEHDSRQDRSLRTGSRRLVAIAAVLLVIALIVVMAARRADQPSTGSSSDMSTVSRPSADDTRSSDPVLPTFTFDTLGPGPPAINVYPGVTDTPANRRPSGAFNHDETVAAICKTRGRTVSSDTSIGEEPRRSDVWIRVDAGIGEMYATFVYGEMSSGKLSDLPECQ